MWTRKTKFNSIVRLFFCLPATSSGFQNHEFLAYSNRIGSHRGGIHLSHLRPKTILANSDYDYDYDDTEEGDYTPKTKRRRVAGPARIRPIRFANSQKSKEAELNRKEAQARHEQALKDPTLLTNVRFQEREDLHPASKRAITEVMGLQTMTEIQSKTYAEVLSGQSVLGRARTGTGKSLAFLLPSLERILANDHRMYIPGRSIGVLIIAPTRELVIQISDQAKMLLTYHNSDDFNVLCLYGGTKIAKDIALLNKNLPTILVCTPGRISDHLESTRLRGKKFSDVIADTSILVLDEADRLMEGFPREMKKILSFLPRSEKRQTLMFSATLPKKMMRSLEVVLPSGYAVVDCVEQNNVKAETNVRVRQSYVELDTMDKYVDGLVAIIWHILGEEENHKTIVFLPTARLVKFFAELFDVGIQKTNTSIFQMHSKMSQSARGKISSAFRKAKQGVLFTTDISARGLDYPDISVVIQYGSPDTVEGYLHRLGRTGRAGNQGLGILVLLPFEKYMLKKLKHRGLERDDKLTKVVDNLPNECIDALLEPARVLIHGGDRVLYPAAETACLSLLAYLMARIDSLSLSKKNAVDLSNRFAVSSGLSEAPLSEELISKLKLEEVVSPKKCDEG